VREPKCSLGELQEVPRKIRHQKPESAGRVEMFREPGRSGVGATVLNGEKRGYSVAQERDGMAARRRAGEDR
jgi:hypothetical protein